jgi:small subunit ribosomal protein S24e
MVFVCDDDTHSLFLPQENSAPVTIRTRKFTTNRLLSRRQFIVDVLHSSRPPVSRADLSEKLGAIYKVDKTRVVPFGFKTHFGGGRSTGFALIYDSEEAQKKFEPRYRLVRVSAPPFRALSIIFAHDYMFSPHRLALRPRWRRLPVNYARSERIVQRRYACSHLPPQVAIALTLFC